MKSLKPVKSNNTSPTLIAENVVAEMRASLDALNAAIVNVNNQIADINAQLDTDAVNETSGTFDTLNTRNANVSNKLNVTDEIAARKVKATVGVEAPRVDADVVSANGVSADTVSANQGNFDNLAVSQCITTPTANITDANITNLSSTNVNLENIATQSINTPAAEVGTLRVQNLQNLAEFSSSVVNANREINAPQVNATGANITNLQANMAKMDALFTQNIEFNTDENDVTQYVLLDPPVDGSNGNNDPTYIEMPAIASGFYRINIKKQNGKYFAVTLINTETAPIVQYDKDEDADIDYLFYDTVTNKLYVKTFAAGKIFWANDSKRTTIAPKTYAELPVDPSLETTLKYRAGGKRRVVVMGNNQLDYGLAVQGVLEATMIKENAAYHQLFYYGDSFEALEFLCDKYLKYEDPLTHQITYTTSQANGYLWHKDDTYRDSDNNEVEAIDYIKYDGGNITIGVNDRVGHDDIILDTLQPGENTTLPFVLSFTLSSIAWDKLMNDEIFNSWGMDRS